MAKKHKKNKHEHKKVEHMHKEHHASEAHHHDGANKKPVSAGMLFLSFLGMIVLIALLAGNIVVSQNIHPLYQGVVDGNKNALVTFFKISRNLAAFQPLKPEMEDSRRELAVEIDGENITRQEKIKKIEELLVKYPNSRDLLYAASVLNHDIGNQEQADEYLRKARVIDPSVGK